MQSIEHCSLKRTTAPVKMTMTIDQTVSLSKVPNYQSTKRSKMITKTTDKPMAIKNSLLSRKTSSLTKAKVATSMAKVNMLPRHATTFESSSIFSSLSFEDNNFSSSKSIKYKRNISPPTSSSSLLTSTSSYAKFSFPSSSSLLFNFNNNQSSTRTMFCSIFMFVILIILSSTTSIMLVDAKVSIEPNPNQEVGMMSTESKYFNCKTDTKGNSEQLSWIGPNDKEIVNDPNNRIYVSSKRNMIKLEIKSPNKDDSGEYKCVARNKQSQKETASEKFRLRIYNPTVVTGNPNILLAEGSNAAMDCIATADRDTSVDFNWMFGNFDLSTDPTRYRIEINREAQRDTIKVTSRLSIRNVTKEHDGKYVCSVDTTNPFVSDEKELRIQLHVQYKPRFDEKTQKYIWISEEAIQQPGQLTVNITCLVQADPVAKIQWLYGGSPGGVVVSSPPHRTSGGVGHPGSGHHVGGTNNKYHTTIKDTENMSELSIKFSSIEEIKSPRASSRIKYICRASNSQGDVSHPFEIKIGRIPDSPQIVSIDYKEGSIILTLNETSGVEPPIDIYRLEIADEQAHLFNRSGSGAIANNSTYVIELNLPRGEHKVNLFAHNPVGWSENPFSSYFLTVVSASQGYTYTSIATLYMMLFSFALVQFLNNNAFLCAPSLSSS